MKNSAPEKAQKQNTNQMISNTKSNKIMRDTVTDKVNRSDFNF